MKATKKFWDSLEKRKEYRNDTLNSLENKLYEYDSDIDTIIYLLKSMKLMNKNINIHQLKSNMDSISNIKHNVEFIEESLNKIYELYTLFLEEEIDKKK
jgi:hypothetical protein